MMIDSKIVKLAFSKHGVKVRVRTLKNAFRVCDVNYEALDPEVCVLPMRELGLFNAFGKNDVFHVNQKHESFLYLNKK